MLMEQRAIADFMFSFSCIFNVQLNYLEKENVLLFYYQVKQKHDP